MDDKKCKYSLRQRFLAVLALTSVLICIITLAASGMNYSRALKSRYESLCETVAELAAGSVNGDSINLWLSGKNSGEHIELCSTLNGIKNNVPEIENIAIYQMRSDGMYTVFDTGSKNVRGGIGEYRPYSGQWEENKSRLISGKEVGKLIVSGISGKMMMYCAPVYDSQSNCAAVACAGVSMGLIESDRTVFMEKYSRLLFAIAFFVFLIAALWIELHMIKPLQKLCKMTKRVSKTGAFSFIKQLTALKIKTGDEIENIWRSTVKLYTDKVQLITSVQKAQENTAVGLAALVSSLDMRHSNHYDNAAQYAVVLTDAMRENSKFKNVITDEMYNNILFAAPLHDLGKISIPDSILNKPGKLTNEEYEIMKEHTVYGSRLLEETAGNISDADCLELARQICESHHERWDGNGYPYGLKGTEIPLPVRIISVADVFDALVSERCYKKAISFDEAYSMIEAESGTHFDPDIVAVFVEIKEQIRGLYESLSAKDCRRGGSL